MEINFLEIGLIIIASSILGLIAKILKQPLILAYIVAGILIGPVFGFISDQTAVSVLANFGVALLLFLVGLELDVRQIKNLGVVTTIISLGQILFSFAVFYLIAIMLGSNVSTAILWGVGLTLSSTVIVIKLISDKNNLSSLYGRILIGILLFQDVIAIIGIIFLNALTNNQASDLTISMSLMYSALKGIGFLIATWLFAKFILPRAFTVISQSIELLFLSGMSWFFALSIISYLLGFSFEIGAFIAGITLAPLPSSIEMTSRVRPLRDFFITIFFVTLGTQIIFSQIDAHLIGIIAILTLAVLIVKPLIILLTMGLLGYKSRVSFMVGIGLAQVSEFSFIAFALAKNYGLVSSTDLTTIITVGMITIAISTYIITHMEKIFYFLRPVMKIFEINKRYRDQIEHIPDKISDHVIIFGCRESGKRIMGTLRRYGKKVLVVDYDPEIIKDLKKQNIPCIFGDMSDIELLDKIALDKAAMVISTVDNEIDNQLMLKQALKRGKKPLVFVVANQLETAIELYKRGANHVIVPHMLSGEFLVKQLREVSGDIEKLHSDTEGHRKKHMAELKELADKYST